jgi:hypothetical protein
MLGNRSFDLTAETPKDPELQAGLEALLKKGRWRNYDLAILDLTDPNKPRFAGVDETAMQTPGSTAKVLLAAGMLQELKNRFPDDFEARRRLLIEHQVSADEWAMPNHHEVPVVTGDLAGKDYKAVIRRLFPGDTFSLYEWMDHTLSPSSNASASMLWREATLMHLLGADYPPTKVDTALLGRWDREAMTRAAFETVDAPVLGAGLRVEDFFIRMFFTHGANRWVKSEASGASPLGLVRWLLRMEQGRIVDEPSSLELKRMLYLTRRRIRYALAPELAESAVFFKTGSLYQCQPEEGYTCAAYQGNVVNVLNAMIVVETPVPASPPAAEPGTEAGPGSSSTGKAPLPPAALPVTPPSKPPAPTSPPALASFYLVGVMSNELKKNAAEDHTRLASAIHALLTGPRVAAAPATP